MIADALRYPIADVFGRTALRRCVIAVIALAVGLRYAAALFPLLVALVPAFVALVGLVGLLGTVSQLVAAEVCRPQRSVRGVLWAGLVALAFSVAVLAPPIALLSLAATETSSEFAPETGAGLFFLFSSTASLFAFMTCAYVYPAAVAASTSARRVRAGLEADAVVPVVTNVTYLLRWTLGFALVVFGVGFTVLTFRRGDVAGLLAAAGAAYFVVAGSRAVSVGYAQASSGAVTP